MAPDPDRPERSVKMDAVRAARKAKLDAEKREKEEQEKKAAAEKAAAEEAARQEAERKAAELELARREAQKDCVMFEVFGEVFTMKVMPREAGADALPVFPADVLHTWEDDWGVRYASRVKFQAPEGYSEGRYLNPRTETLPEPPVVTKLIVAQLSQESVLRDLKLALKAHAPVIP